MNTDRLNGLPILLCLTALGLFQAPALAVLGQTLATHADCPSPTPKCATPTVGQLAESGLFSAHETQLETNTVIKEYARPDGLVFAVSWRGPVVPDLTQLLGTYFPVFKQAQEEPLNAGKRGSPLSLAKDGLVVQASGRSPHFFGYAYVTHLVPPGINVKDVVQ